MRVSVICTVLNEGESVRRLLDSLCNQTRPPDEVVVVDGGSADRTVEIVAGYAVRLPLRLLVEPGANISRGRNLAIGAAAGDVIASTDAGVWLEPSWLAELVAPLESAPGVQVVAGFFVADASTPFDIAMGATVLPALADVNPQTFLPSSRSVAFRKSAWSAAGGYPEWLDYCEDLIFDLRLAASGPFAWAPGAVAHFRPRSSLRAYFKQYYRYARGDGKADLWRKRHGVRYVTYLLALPALLWLATRGATGAAARGGWPASGSGLAAIALLGGAAAYCAGPYRRLLPALASLTPRERLAAAVLVPVIRATGDLAKMLGYPSGWAWRLRNRRRLEIHWRV